MEDVELMICISLDFLDYGLQQNTIFVFGLLSVLSLSVVVVLES